MIYLTLWPIIGIAIGMYRLRLSIKSYGPLPWHGYIVGAVWAAILGPAIPILLPRSKRMAARMVKN